MSAIYTGPMTYWTTGARVLKRLPRLLNSRHAATIDTTSYNYLGNGDRALIKDALFLGCDSFLTMENKLPRNADHIQSTLGIRGIVQSRYVGTAAAMGSAVPINVHMVSFHKG